MDKVIQKLLEVGRNKIVFSPLFAYLTYSVATLWVMGELL